MNAVSGFVAPHEAIGAPYYFRRNWMK